MLSCARENAVNDEGVQCNNQNWHYDGDGEGEANRDPFVHSIGVLKGVIREGEVLVEWLHSVKALEDDEEESAPGQQRWRIRL